MALRTPVEVIINLHCQGLQLVNSRNEAGAIGRHLMAVNHLVVRQIRDAQPDSLIFRISPEELVWCEACQGHSRWASVMARKLEPVGIAEGGDGIIGDMEWRLIPEETYPEK